MQDGFEGKRVIVMWNDEAFDNGKDWVAFRVIAQFDEGAVMEGVDSPSGDKHDGSRVLVRWDEVNQIIEWDEP